MAAGFVLAVALAVAGWTLVGLEWRDRTEEDVDTTSIQAISDIANQEGRISYLEQALEDVRLVQMEQVVNDPIQVDPYGSPGFGDFWPLLLIGDADRRRRKTCGRRRGVPGNAVHDDERL